jgi:hypothetical protein
MTMCFGQELAVRSLCIRPGFHAGRETIAQVSWRPPPQPAPGTCPWLNSPNASWDTSSNNWIAGAGSYQILVGNSSRDLPLTGTLNVSSPITANAMS